MTFYAELRQDHREYWEKRASYYMDEARTAKRIGLSAKSVAGWVHLAWLAHKRARKVSW